MPPQLVHVHADHENYFAARDCHLYHPDETIAWVNHTDHDLTIHFDESPFNGNDFVVPREGTLNSPPLKLDVLHNIVDKKVFSYELRPPAFSTAVAADPNVIVHKSGA